MTVFGAVRTHDWIKDDLPDLLWPSLVLALQDTQAALGFVRWQGAVQTALKGKADEKLVAESLDGTLTGLDRLARAHPDTIATIRSCAEQCGLLPPEVTSALSSFHGRPAEWLIDDEIHPPTQPDIDLLVRAMSSAVRDGHREAVIKCLQTWSLVQAGMITMDAETVDLLKSYPNDVNTRSEADTVVRASWLAAKGMLEAEDPSRTEASSDWARRFWTTNSMTTRCVRARESPDTESNPDTPLTGLSEPADLHQRAMDIISSYVEALETSPSRLYDQERQEVHAGLVTHVGRSVVAVLESPHLWCSEHSSHVTRSLVEAHVYLRWMASQDDSIYRRYQEYGRGKAKLYARILNELPESARGAGFSDGLAELSQLSYTDDVIDLRVVDTSDSFSGKSIRAMAEECGLLDFYRRAYYIASGVTHAEWWSVETHAMERCHNILHRGHLIPSLSVPAGGNVELAQSWISLLYGLIRTSLSILGTDRATVANAFAWLDDSEAGDDAE